MRRKLQTLFLFMRYYEAPPQEWTSYYGSVYRCNHPVYRVCTLYRERGKGLCVIQQRYNEKTKATYWSAIDPWLTDKIYLRTGFKEYFDSHAKPKNKNGEYPTVTVRQIMWALRIQSLCGDHHKAGRCDRWVPMGREELHLRLRGRLHRGPRIRGISGGPGVDAGKEPVRKL